MQPLLNNLLELRQRYQAQPDLKSVLDSCRVFHGRGRCYPGLEFVCVDFFQPVLLITLYAEPPANWLEQLREAAEPLLGSLVEVAWVQRRYLPGAPGECLWGEMPDETFARRGSLKFLLPLGQQQNSGFFLDMEPGRRWLEREAPGRRVLNLFAYTCAFSVVAVAAGAERVVNVDMSSRALALGRDNHRINDLDKAHSEFMAQDIMKSWGRIKRRGPYDLVILDPPSYQPGSFVAVKDYARCVRRLPELMPGGGKVLACLNAPELDEEFLRGVFGEHCPGAVPLERLPPSPDFPDIDQAQQLKLLVFELPPVAAIGSNAPGSYPGG